MQSKNVVKKWYVPLRILAEVLLVGLVLFAIYDVWYNLKRREELCKVIDDRKLADSIHTAVLTSLMDPEIMNNHKYAEDFEELTTEMDITQYWGDGNCILVETTKILGLDNLYQLRGKFKSSGATGRVLVTVTAPHSVRVVLEGTQMDEGEITVGN